jgi:F-type H+-transporting ATPase subunit b
MKRFVRVGKARYVVSLLVVVSVLFAFGSVWASSEGGGHEAEGGLDKGKDLIWRIMNFALLAGILIFLLRKPLPKALASRRQGIKDELDDLEAQKGDAEKQLAGYKEKLSLLDKEVERIVAEYIQEGEAVKANIIEEARAAAEKLQEQAKKNIEHEFHKAKQQLKAEMADEAVAMAEKLIKKDIKPKDQKRLIDEYLTKVVVAQ